jgi:hypothetical protein
MKQRGSARFEPYYKVQWFDEISMCWRDVQQAHPTEAGARSAFIDGRRCRIMEINMRGRQVLAHAATFQNSASVIFFAVSGVYFVGRAIRRRPRGACGSVLPRPLPPGRPAHR